MTEEVKVLSGELVRVFGMWVGTPSEELLEDSGTVLDWMRNETTLDVEAISQQTWDAAWELFDRATGRA
ncbi:hypothetical protein [Alicyclobacillus sp. ALC3]|uniref:hypothetical protein n=1 Tax=Alicyclobacillus sp. ALC3 TaxID=2796143 RepID=UPI0023788304|nr:hypothetical protein [Alicyclobacillus sp. ALC3]WDL99765.1 hypothetical protein JC200_23620 [Alicyclobacillus sp. ALC3]